MDKNWDELMSIIAVFKRDRVFKKLEKEDQSVFDHITHDHDQ